MAIEENEPALPNDARVIVFHKHGSSARTRFLRLPHGGVCGFQALPTLVSVLDAHDAPVSSSVVSHPSAVMVAAEQCLGLDAGSLEYEPEFQEQLDAPGGVLNVYLARCTSIDPPFEAAERIGAQFIAITDARGIKDAELQLLQRAYQVIMG